ncbi:hypothetical protein SK128_017245, partial [Halocaridina rubra]
FSVIMIPLQIYFHFFTNNAILESVKRQITTAFFEADLHTYIAASIFIYSLWNLYNDASAKNLISLTACVFHIWAVCKPQVLKRDVSEISLQLKQPYCKTNSLKSSVDTFEKFNQELEKENCKLEMQLQSVHQNNIKIQQMLSEVIAEHCNQIEQSLRREKAMLYQLRMFEETITELEDKVDEGKNVEAKLLCDLNEVMSARESLKAQIEDMRESFNTIALEVESEVEEMQTQWAKTETEAEEKMYKMQIKINGLNIEADKLEWENANQRHLINSLQKILWQKKDKTDRKKALRECSYHDIQLDVMKEEELEERMTYLKEIGEGGNGAAHSILFDHVNCVLKTFHDGLVDIREARIMKYLDGAGGAPKLLGITKSNLVCTSAGDIGMDYIFTKMTEEYHLLYFVYEVAKQVEMLHSKNIIHCDLKLDNIIFDTEENEVNIIDFGLSCMLGEQVFKKGEARSGEKYRCTWMAPELNEGEPATFASDIYSLGFLLACALVRFPKPNPEALYLVGIATREDPVKRPTLEEFLAILVAIHSGYDDGYQNHPNVDLVFERVKKVYPELTSSSPNRPPS